MTKELLKEKVGKILNVSQSEVDLGFELMLKKISELLNFDEALKIPDIGAFTLKKEPLTREERLNRGASSSATKKSLIFSPATEDITEDSTSMFLSFDIDSPEQNSFEFNDNVFSIGVGKPIITPSGVQSVGSSEDRTMKTTIEEKVSQLVANSERFPGFDFLNEYLSSSGDLDDSNDLIKADNSDLDEDLKQIISQNVEQTSDNEDFDEQPAPAVDNAAESSDDPNKELENPPLETEKPLEEKSDSEEEIKWNWGEELKEELEVEDEESLDEPSGEEVAESSEKETETSEIIEPEDSVEEEAIEENLDDGATDNSEDDLASEDESQKNVTDQDDDDSEEASEEDDDEAEDDEAEDDEAEDDGSTTDDENENEDDEEIVEDEPKDSTPSPVLPEKKKFAKMGKTFWILLSTFIIIGLAGGYYIFFTGNGGPEDYGNLTGISDTLNTKRLSPAAQPIINIAKDDSIISSVDSLANQRDTIIDLSSVASSPPAEDPISSDTKEENPAPVEQKTDNTIPQNQTEVKQNPSTIVQNQSGLYRKFADEKQISNLIFSHNGEFSFQISSWNNKVKAEAETRRLRNVGYNAFIVESYLSALRSTWYRVRIGFFKSKEEAIQYRQNNTF